MGVAEKSIVIFFKEGTSVFSLVYINELYKEIAKIKQKKICMIIRKILKCSQIQRDGKFCERGLGKSYVKSPPWFFHGVLPRTIKDNGHMTAHGHRKITSALILFDSEMLIQNLEKCC